MRLAGEKIYAQFAALLSNPNYGLSAWAGRLNDKRRIVLLSLSVLKNYSHCVFTRWTNVMRSLVQVLWLWFCPGVLLLLVLEQQWVGFCFNQQVSCCVVGIVTERPVKMSFCSLPGSSVWTYLWIIWTSRRWNLPSTVLFPDELVSFCSSFHSGSPCTPPHCERSRQTDRRTSKERKQWQDGCFHSDERNKC